jgi:hypothetical protein
MAEQAPLYFRKVLGGLRPANRAATEAMAVLDDGDVRVRITRTRGNTRRNGLYWAILGVACPMLDEKAPGLNVDLLHRVLKDRYGLYKEIVLPSGQVVRDYDSISFSKMAEPERAKFIDWALKTLASWLGVTEEELRQEGMAA